MEKTFILILALILSEISSPKEDDGQGMHQAYELWEEGKIEDVSALTPYKMQPTLLLQTDIQPNPRQFEESTVLFDNFNPESVFHLKWGNAQAVAKLEDCNRS